MKGFNHYRKRTHLSVSSLVSFARCPRKFFLSSGCGLCGQSAQAPLLFGEALHMGIPAAWDHWNGTQALEDSIEHGLKSFMTIWTRDPVESDDKRNPLRARAMIENFLECHINRRSIYEMIPPKDLGIECTQRSPFELPFAIDIGLSIPLVGYIDCLGKHRDSGKIWPVDFKTSSEISTRLFNCFDINAQGMCYAVVCQQLVPNSEPGIIIDAIRVSNKNDENVIHMAYYNEELLEKFIEWARWTGSRLLACEEKGEFPADISACTPYSQYGMPGYQCGYINLCQTNDWTDYLGMFNIAPPREFVL